MTRASALLLALAAKMVVTAPAAADAGDPKTNIVAPASVSSQLPGLERNIAKTLAARGAG